jgi:hypothetical protein
MTNASRPRAIFERDNLILALEPFKKSTAVGIEDGWFEFSHTDDFGNRIFKQTGMVFEGGFVWKYNEESFEEFINRRKREKE